MLEILEFIFRDFWTFCGVVILLCIIGEDVVASLSTIVCIFHKNIDNKEKRSSNES